MKISMKTLGLAVVALTLVGGCTKKNTSNSKPAQAKAKTDADKPVAQPIKSQTPPEADPPQPAADPGKAADPQAQADKTVTDPKKVADSTVDSSSPAIIINGPIASPSADTPGAVIISESKDLIPAKTVTEPPKVAVPIVANPAPVVPVPKTVPIPPVPPLETVAPVTATPVVPLKPVVKVETPAPKIELPAVEKKEVPKVTATVPTTQPKVTPEEKDKAAIDKFNKCFEDKVNKGLAAAKKIQDDLVPNVLYVTKYAASGSCEVAAIESKVEGLNSILTNKVIELATVAYPNGTKSIKFFAETEAKVMDRAERKKTYESFVSEVKDTKSAGAAVVPAQATPQTVKKEAAKVETKDKKTTADTAGVIKDLAGYQACLKTNGDSLVDLFASKNSVIDSPMSLAAIKHALNGLCKFSGSGDQSELINKVIAESSLAKFPASKDVVDFFTTVEKQNVKDTEKIKIYSAYTTNVEVSSTKVRFQGPVDPSQISGNIITYSIENYTGDKLVTIRASGKETSDKKVLLNQKPTPGLRFVLNFSLKSNNTGTLSIIEGQNSVDLDFVFSKNSLEQFKTGQPATISITPESWTKFLFEGIQKVAMDTFKGKTGKDFIYAKDPKETTVVRTCDLTDKLIECVDPDFKTKATINPAAFLKTK